MIKARFMEEHKHIKDYIVDYLLEDEDEKRLDPVLAEWLAEDESHRKEFDLYKKIWKESHRYIEPEIFDPDLAWEEVNKINRQKVYLRKSWKTYYMRLPGLPHLYWWCWPYLLWELFRKDRRCWSV